VIGAALSFQNVGKVFTSERTEPFMALSGVRSEIRPGTFICVVGPSGCGKSTLLNLAAGLIKPTIGSVRYYGQEVNAVNTDVAYVTQRDNLLPWRTVELNVRLPLEIRGVGTRDAQRAAVWELLERVGLEDSAHLYPSELSGGMRKRVALARCLIYAPRTLLMDEPFSALDAQRKFLIQQDLTYLWESTRNTVLFVTHDIEEALLLGDSIVVFGAAPGRIIHMEKVNLPRPRRLLDVRQEAEFADAWTRIWTLLGAEIDERRVKRHSEKDGIVSGGSMRKVIGDL